MSAAASFSAAAAAAISPTSFKMGSIAAVGSISNNGICLRKIQDETRYPRVRNLRVRSSVASKQESLQFSKADSHKLEKTVRIGVLGASGYTGSEIVRLLASHPYFDITLMTADKKAGQSIGSVFPHLATQDLPDMVAVKDADFSDVDAVFCCLPHGTTQEIIKSLPTRLKIVDLSADFRLRDVSEYEEWYGQPHKATDLQKEAVYGLTEILRTEIQSARLVANPGCFPTSILLPLIPLINFLLECAEQLPHKIPLYGSSFLICGPKRIESTLPIEPWYIGGPVIKGFGRGSKVLGIPIGGKRDYTRCWRTTKEEVI